MKTSIACDPTRSIVVEACAGSGKTWLLTARIVRALLAGTPPGRILALTFTNKAASEMASRVWSALEQLALGSPDAQRASLELYGLSGQALEAALDRADSLYETVLLSPERPVIATFHAWYGQLLFMAPREAAHLANLRPAERPYERRQAVWQRFLDEASRRPALEIDALAADLGLSGLQEALWDWMAYRAFLTSHAISGPSLAEAEAAAQACLRDWVDAHQGLAHQLHQAFATLNGREDLAEALAHWSVETLPQLIEALYVKPQDSRPRRRLPQRFVRKADRAAWGDRAQDIEDMLVRFAESLNDCLETADQMRQAARQRALMRCGQLLAQLWRDEVESTDETDFDGLEARVLALLESESGPDLLARVDARTDQILVDEFQDTSPIQWRVLKTWLEGHAKGQGADAVAPSVFLVGDPKQAIYRFRGADPLVFEAATGWLVESFGAERLQTDTTRRCHPAVVDLVNAGLHQRVPGRVRAHHAHHISPRGYAAALPRIPKESQSSESADGVVRDWLTDPLQPRLISPWYREGVQIAGLLHEARTALALGWSDMRILLRSRTHMADYERALLEAGIPFVSDRSGGLLHEPEIEDLISLLRLLAHPWSNADVARILRSPLIGKGNDWLVCLGEAAAETGQTWWALLVGLVGGGEDRECLPHGANELAGRLLRWRDWSRRLPVHDLLDRLLQDGLWERAVGYGDGLRADQVRANWAALLDLSLRWDGGRHPSLSGFVQDMTVLAQAPAGEAPGPGLLETQAEAVSIQSLHSAKGLESELVVLAGLEDQGTTDRGLLWLPEWNADRTDLQALHAWRRFDAQTDIVAQLLEERASLEEQERTNLLYVAVTRARRFLFVSAVEGRKEDTWYAQLADCLPLYRPGQLSQIEDMR